MAYGENASSCDPFIENKGNFRLKSPSPNFTLELFVLNFSNSFLLALHM